MCCSVSASGMSRGALWFALWWCAAAMAREHAGVVRTRLHYSVESALELSTEGAAAVVGYRLRGRLDLEPLWTDPDPAASKQLLRFTLQDVQLESSGAAARAEAAVRPSAWDAPARRRTHFYALRDHARLAALYLPRLAAPDLADYQRALLALFHFHLQDGPRNETDVSGDCHVLYETLSPVVFRKIKRRCAFETEAEWGGVGARRVSRYTLSPAHDALHDVFAEEEVSVRAGAGEAAVRARSWHALALLTADTVPASAPAASLEDALHALPGDAGEAPLELQARADEDAEDEEPGGVEGALERHSAALQGWEAGAGGGAAEAAAAPALVAALQAAPRAALTDLLHRPDMQDKLAGLCRALGLAGGAAAWGAARALLAPHAEDALEPLALHYLAGLALAQSPHDDTAADVLRLGEEARLPSIAEQALLAGAAAAARCSEATRAAARARLGASLARCRDAACRALRLRAIGNLRRAADAEPLLAAAESTHDPLEAEAALDALRRAGAGSALAARLARLAEDGARALPVRALALELSVQAACGGEGGTVPLALVRLARVLRAQQGRAAHELRRTLWQRLDTLADSEAVRALRRVMPRDLTSWDARAHGGGSSVLVRETGWRGAGRRALLDSAQLARGGSLLRGRVALLAAPHDAPAPLDDLLAVEVWTRGLDAMMGGAEDAAGAEEVGAGLRVGVAGAAGRGAALFESQAELLAQVWAGAGAAPVPVLRALVPRSSPSLRVPLQAGLALAARAQLAAALALDAHGAASLWYRTARGSLALRAAGHARVAAAVRAPWATLRARAEREASPALRIDADLDFYGEPTLCVRAQLADHDERWEARLESSCGARAARVRRRRGAETQRPGRTLALGRINDAACRTLRAADEPA